MKKLLSLILVLVMVLSLVACGGEKETSNNNDTNTNTENQQDDNTPVDNTAFKVAMVTDYGDITDQSFNQTTYEACQAFCTENGLDFTYFKPASDSDEDRIASIEQAIDEGYNVIVMPGYAFGKAIKETAGDNPDVTFIALDVSQADLGEDYVVPSNVTDMVSHRALMQQQLSLVLQT